MFVSGQADCLAVQEKEAKERAILKQERKQERKQAKKAKRKVS